MRMRWTDMLLSKAITLASPQVSDPPVCAKCMSPAHAAENTLIGWTKGGQGGTGC